MSKILKIEHLTKNYSNSKNSVNILENLCLEVEEGEFLCILGSSGCGKTTLLRCIAGFETFTGNIFLYDKNVIKPGSDRGMVFQNFDQLFPWKTVEENLIMVLQMSGIKEKSQLHEIAHTYLCKVRMENYKTYYPHQMSGGMKQRVAIARALALNSKIILMDEPFASLDAMSRRMLQEEVVRIKEEENLTIIFVTHNIQEALILGTRSIILREKGHIILDQKNTLSKPITPSSPGYGETWDLFYRTLENIQKP